MYTVTFMYIFAYCTIRIVRFAHQQSVTAIMGMLHNDFARMLTENCENVFAAQSEKSLQTGIIPDCRDFSVFVTVHSPVKRRVLAELPFTPSLGWRHHDSSFPQLPSDYSAAPGSPYRTPLLPVPR